MVLDANLQVLEARVEARMFDDRRKVLPVLRD
jgi:hypothetical protein